MGIILLFCKEYEFASSSEKKDGHSLILSQHRLLATDDVSSSTLSMVQIVDANYNCFLSPSHQVLVKSENKCTLCSALKSKKRKKRRKKKRNKKKDSLQEQTGVEIPGRKGSKKTMKSTKKSSNAKKQGKKGEPSSNMGHIKGMPEANKSPKKGSAMSESSKSPKSPTTNNNSPQMDGMSMMSQGGSNTKRNKKPSSDQQLDSGNMFNNIGI